MKKVSIIAALLFMSLYSVSQAGPGSSCQTAYGSILTRHGGPSITGQCLQAETISYLALPGVSLTPAQIASLDGNIRAIKYGSGVTLDLTGTFSLATYHFARDTSIDLRPYLGFYATFNDGTANTMKARVLSVGTSEVLGAVQNVTAFENNSSVPYDSFDGASATGFHAVSTAGSKKAVSADEISLIAKGLLRASFTYTKASGTAPSVTIGTRPDGASSAGTERSNIATLISGTNIAYLQTLTTETGVVRFIHLSGTIDYTIDDLAVQAVQSPPATGVWFDQVIDKGIVRANINSVTLSRIGAEGVLLGDSFSAGTVLTTAIHADANNKTYVYGAGLSGDDFAGANARYTADVSVHSPKFVVVEIGMNDIDDENADPQNTKLIPGLQSLVAKILADGAVPVICNVGPFKDHPDYTEARMGYWNAWKAWLATYCSTNGYQLVDIFAVLDDPADPGGINPLYDSGDGYHPNAAGKTAMAAAIVAKINAAMGF